MKNVLKTIIVPLFAICCLAGCGGNRDGGGSSETIKIKFMHRNSQTSTEVLQQFIDAFQKEYPNIEVTNYKYGGNYEALKKQVVTDLQTEDYPDIVECYPDHVERYFDFGKVVKLDSYINDREIGFDILDHDDIIDSFMDEGKKYSMEGTYSLPFSKSTEALFYNANILGTVIPGVNDGTPINEEYINSLTWDELFNVLCPGIEQYNLLNPLNKLYDDTGDKSAIFGWDSDENLFVTLAEQYQYGYTDVDVMSGQGKLLFNNPEMRALMPQFKRAYDNKYFTTTGTVGDYVNTLFTKNQCLFSVGSTAGYSYQCKDCDFEVAVANIPQSGTIDGKRAVINQGPSVCFLRHGTDSERIKASFLFYKYMIQMNHNATWTTETGYLPIRNSVTTTNKYMNYISTDIHSDPVSIDHLAAITMKYAQEVLNSGDLFSNVTFTGSSDCRSYCGALLTSILKEENPDALKIETMFNEAENNIKAAMK